MAIVALAGDGTTTTALALYATWPRSTPIDVPAPVVVEADPTGGSLSAWLDTSDAPSLSTVVAALHRESDSHGVRGSWSTIDPLIRRSESGVRFIPAPFLASEARGAVEQAGAVLLPTLADSDHTVALLDLGRVDATRPHPAVRFARSIVLCHRQETASPAAATVRLERLAECVSACSAASTAEVEVLLIGSSPFGPDEVGPFVGVGNRCRSVAVDPLAAAVLAGRRGVSARRLGRLPLMRSAGAVAAEIAERSSPGGRRASASPTEVDVDGVTT